METLFEGRQRLGEAILWHAASRQILWIDLLEPCFYAHDPASGKTRSLPLPLEAPLGAIVATSDPETLILSHLGGLSLLKIADGSMAPFVNPEAGRDGVSFNDCKVDRWGRLWAGTCDRLEREPRGCLWSVLPSGQCYLGDVGFVVANGPAFSPDGRVLYFNDTMGRQTLAYDLSADDPYPRRRRLLVQYAEEEGLPDGVTVDAEGCLWIAHWGGARLTRISPEGRRLQTIAVPAANVTAMCFAGERLDTLYVTTAREGVDAAMLERYPQSGDTFVFKPGVAGLAEPLFAIAA